MNSHLNGEQASIQFQAITSGLGFHPFSDGLPYSYTIKEQPSELPARSRLNASFSQQTLIQKDFVQKDLVQKELEKTGVRTIEEPKEGKFGTLYLFRRSLAYLVDSAAQLVLFAVISAIVLQERRVDVHFLLDPVVILLGVLLFLFQNWLVLLMQEMIFGTTLGKKLLGLKIEGSPIEILLRSLLFFPSVGFLGGGLIWSLFNSKRRCWHDWISDIQPSDNE